VHTASSPGICFKNSLAQQKENWGDLVGAIPRNEGPVTNQQVKAPYWTALHFEL
jgi:hypothetical protein